MIWLLVTVWDSTEQHVCVAVAHWSCVGAFRAAVGRSVSDGEVYSADGSLHCEEGGRSAAQQHRHHAHPALHQLLRPHQQPHRWSVHILKDLIDSMQSTFSCLNLPFINWLQLMIY